MSKVIGVSCHIGSQLTEVEPFVEAVQRIKELVLKLRAEGMNIRYMDIGGGLGITYNQEEPPHPRDYAQALMKELRGNRLHPDPGARPGHRRQRGGSGHQSVVHQGRG